MSEVNLSDAINRIVHISKLASAMLIMNGELSPRSEHHEMLVAALDDPTLPHDWEALEELAALITGEPGLADAVADAVEWIDLYRPRMIGDERADLLRRLAAALATTEDGDGNG